MKDIPKDYIQVGSTYGWIPFMLLGQSALLYMPRFLWKAWEKNFATYLVQDLGNPVLIRIKSIEQIASITRYMQSNKHKHMLYCMKYFFSLLMNFLVLEVQFHIIRRLCGTSCDDYDGWTLWNNSMKMNFQRTDAMKLYFPSLAACVFSIVGASGNVVNLDLLCTLSNGPLYEKIFILEW